MHTYVHYTHHSFLLITIQMLYQGTYFWHKMEFQRKKRKDQMEPGYVHGILEEMKLIRDNLIREEHVKHKYQEHAQSLLEHIASNGGRNSFAKLLDEKDLPKELRKSKSSLGFAPVAVVKKTETRPKKSQSFPHPKISKIVPKEAIIDLEENKVNMF